VRLRNAIFSGTYAPGYQLKEETLAAEFGISRTPVREAIRMLADEGLVDIRSNRRSYVADATETQFEEIFDLLCFLEGYSAGLAAERIPKSAIANLRALNDEMLRMSAPNHNRKFLELNSEFHRAIHQHSESHKVHELLYRIIDFPHSLFLKFDQIPDTHNTRSIIEHGLIVDALESGNAQFATLQMQAHTESVRHAFRTLWRTNGKH